MTNIDDALKLALIETEGSANELDVLPIIVLLTDGEPTAGEANTKRILTNIRRRNSAFNTPIFCLSFGEHADFDFLKKISLENNGFARRIYEGSDASIQLMRFYEETSIPLLTDISITYLNESVVTSTLSQHKFKTYFNGSELVVTGKLTDPDMESLKVEVTASSGSGNVTYPATAVPDALNR